jgi:hypothetical protein
VEAASDHEVQHKPKISLDANSNPLADATEFADHPALNAGERWVDCTENEDAGQSNPLDRSPKNAILEGTNVSGYVGEFRHKYKIATGTGLYAMGLFGFVLAPHPWREDAPRMGTFRP